MTGMEALPLRLSPDMDLRRALEAAVATRLCRAAFVISGIGSLRHARLRLAGMPGPDTLNGDLEILTLAGTISHDGSHFAHERGQRGRAGLRRSRRLRLCCAHDCRSAA